MRFLILRTTKQTSGDAYSAQHWSDAKAPLTDEDEEGLLHISNRGDVDNVPDEPEGKWLHWRTLAAYVGPGFLVCIAYLDPGNLEADLQVRYGGEGAVLGEKGCMFSLFFEV